MNAQNGRHLDPVAHELLALPLPPGWVRSSIAELGEVRLGRQRSPKNRSSKHPTKYIRAANIKWDGLALSDVLDMEFRPEEMEAYRLLPGDVLLAEASGSASEVGKPVVWNGEIEDCCFQNTVVRFRSTAVAPQFARLAFLHFARNNIFSRVSKGVGIHHLSADRFSVLPFLLPPAAEQQRIVTKCEEMLSELDAGVAALKRVQANLKRYRSAVLKAAVDGQLTEAWRKDNCPAETGAGLLARILKERRRLWEERQRATFATAGKQLPKNWQEKYSEPASPDTSSLPTLPKGWCWASLEALADVTGGLTKDQKRADEVGVREIPYLRVANVQRGHLDLDEMKLIYASNDDIQALRLKPGDVLFTEGGDRDKLGRGWVWNGQLAECIHQNHIFRARLFSQEMESRLVSHHGNSFGKEWFTKAGKQTTNLASINLGMLRQFPVPVPPADEQKELVAILDRLLPNMEEAEREVIRGLARASRLRQSLLKTAFEGHLVAQDASDEPASVLLARIQRQRVPSSATAAAAARPSNEQKEIFLRRAAVVSYTVQRLAKHRSFGRTQLEKTLHLTQSHIGVDLGLAFERYAAGPFDKAIYKLERVAKKKEWFSTQDRPKFGVTYHPGSRIEEMCRYATGCLGSKQSDLDRLLDHVSQMNTEEAELFATAYAAWNDLLLDGRSADDDAIIAEVYGWHDEKKKFARQTIRIKLQWMRKHGYVPRGQGQRTTVVGKETHLRSRRGRKRTPTT